jgi:hypothetical protein
MIKGEQKKQRSKNMEEFVTQIKDSIEYEHQINESNRINSKDIKYRELFKHVLAASPEIEVDAIEINGEGDIKFEVPMKQMGISYEVFLKFKQEIMSSYGANFIGELIIRESLDMFVKVLTDLKDSYFNTVNRFSHQGFGLKFVKNKMIFTVNASYIQAIMVENFKRKMR